MKQALRRFRGLLPSRGAHVVMLEQNLAALQQEGQQPVTRVLSMDLPEVMDVDGEDGPS